MTDEEIKAKLTTIRERSDEVRVKREGDMLIAKTLKLAARGLIAIMIFWVAWMIITGLVASRENRRIDELTRRVEQLERRIAPVEKP